ncbi:MAG: fimbrillin family protein [Prevotella sp.]|nr:fimbrillin family protein [Prevotella sp.]
MKKQLLSFMFMAFSATAFIACSSSDEAANEQGNQLKLSAGITAQKEPYNIGEWGTEIQIGDIEAAIAKEFKVDTTAITRTPCDDSNWAGMTNRNIAVKVGSTVYKYSVDASGNLTSNAPYYFTTTSNVSVASWYPYTTTSLTSFSVQSDQTSYANREKSDLLYGAATVNQGSANVISYSHKVAKLIVSVKVNNTQHIANGTISKLTMSGIKLSGTVSNGTLTASGSNGTITLHNTIASSTSNNNSTATFEAYLIPQTSTSTFVVSVGGTNLSIAVPSKTFVAGKIHTLELIYNVAGSGTENGHAWVRMGTSVKWATTNLGANNDYNKGSYYQWGATIPTATCDNNDNLTIAYSGTDPWSSSNKYGYWNVTYDITPTSGHDCARILWGGTWRMPTKSEQQQLIDNCTWEKVEYHSKTCAKITAKNGNVMYWPFVGSVRIGNGNDWAFRYMNSTYVKSHLYDIMCYDADAPSFSPSANKDYGRVTRPVLD